MSGHAELAEAMKRSGAQASYGSSLARYATVSSYDPANYAVKVLIQPEAIESNWMPLGAIGIGTDWGVAVGPQIGDHVIVEFPEGDFNSGVVIARIFSTQQVAMNVPSGEVWVVHKLGSFMKLTNDGKVGINGELEIDATAPTINITATGPINISGGGTMTLSAPTIDLVGNLNVTGNTSLTGTLTNNGVDVGSPHKHTSNSPGTPTSTPF
jgi:phage baseplate assembly protein V